MKSRKDFDMERGTFGKYFKLFALLLGITVIIILSMVFVILYSKRNIHNNEENPNQAVNENVAESTIFIKDYDKGIDELLSKFYDATLNMDKKVLNELFNRSEEEQAQDNNTNISVIAYEQFEDINNYVAKGISDNSYVVYSSSKIKFRGVETAAPVFMYFYIDTKEDGSLYIKDANSLSQQEADLVAEYNKDPFVMELDKNMRTELAKNVVYDKKLATLYSMFSKGYETDEDVTYNSPEHESEIVIGDGIEIDNKNDVSVKAGKDMTEE